MKASSLFRIATAGLMTWASVPATAQPITSPDGQPTAETCAALGFSQRPTYGGPVTMKGMQASTARPRAPAPPPPPPPPPPRLQPRPPVSANRPNVIPPLPVPPVERRIEEPRPTTERYPQAVANPIRQVAEAPVSTFSIDVDTASYANTRRFLLREGVRPPADAVRVEELLNYFDYGYRRPASAKIPFAPYVAVTPAPWASGRQLIHVGLQGYQLASAERPPLNLVFLVDTSGSMMSPDKLPLAQQALNLLIDRLRPQDRISLVAYAGSAGAVLGPTDGRQKLKMRCALGALQAGGSTAGGQGLALAYALATENFDPKGVNRVVLVTDGDFNVGVSDPGRLKEFVADKRKTGVYLSVYGMGRGNYNDAMMQALAQNGNGTAGYIDSLQEARKLFGDQLSRSMFPIADDVKIQVEFNPARVREYRLIGYETRALAREDFNNDQVDAGEVGAGASVTAVYEITPVGAAGSVDPLRYGRRAPPPAGGAELAFLKIRYKLPGEATSRLIDRPITLADASASLAAAPEATRWAVAVAGFGQKLRRDPRLAENWGWSEIVALAQSARGGDPNGERAEFVQVVKAAADAKAPNESY